MIKIILGFVLLLFAHLAFSQEVKEIKYDKSYDSLPQPTKGIQHFTKFLEKKIDIPINILAKLKEGKIIFSIALSDRGKLSTVEFESYLDNFNLKENALHVVNEYFEKESWNPAILNNESQNSIIKVFLEIRPKPRTGYYNTSVSIQVVDQPTDIWFVKAKSPIRLKTLIKSLSRRIPDFDTQTSLIYEIDDKGNLIRFEAETDSEYAKTLANMINDKIKGKKWRPEKIKNKKLNTTNIITITNYPIVRSNHPLAK